MAVAIATAFYAGEFVWPDRPSASSDWREPAFQTRRVARPGTRVHELVDS